MTTFFTFTYLALSLVVFIEALILRRVLRKTLSFRRLLRETATADWKGLRVGARAPRFSAEILETGEVFHSSNLKGQLTILVFVSPSDASSRLYANLAAVIHVFWHRVKSNIYIVCTGAGEQCRQVVHDHCKLASNIHFVRTILDRTGSIARAFRITETPQAVELDEDARLRRYGRPEPNDGDMNESFGEATFIRDSA